MITLAVLRETLHDLDELELQDWIARRWVRPVEQDDGYQFEEIDVARLRLIRTLRHEMQIEAGTVPMVLSLLDQLHEALRRLAWKAGALPLTPLGAEPPDPHG